MSLKNYFLLLLCMIFQARLSAQNDVPYQDTDKVFGQNDFSIEMPEDLQNIERFPIEIEELEWRFREQKERFEERQKERRNFEDEQGYLDEEYVKELIAHAPQKIRDIIQDYKDSKTQTSPQARAAFIKTALLLVGPPGNGKSDLSKAIAQEMGVPFVCVNSALLGNEYQNSATSNLERTLERAHRLHPDFVVIIFEEMQALTDKDHAKHNHQDPGFALGTLMDKYSKNKNMLFIANANDATNIPEQIKSRFHKAIVEIKEPDYEAKQRMLSFHLREQLQNKSLDKAMLPLIAARARKFSARDIKDLSEDIIKTIVRKSPDTISIHDCDSLVSIMKSDISLTEINRLQQTGNFIREYGPMILKGIEIATTLINIGLIIKGQCPKPSQPSHDQLIENGHATTDNNESSNLAPSIGVVG